MEYLPRDIFPGYFSIAQCGALARTCRAQNAIFRDNIEQICMAVARAGTHARALVRALVWADNGPILAKIASAGMYGLIKYFALDAVEFGHSELAELWAFDANPFDLECACIRANNMKLFRDISGGSAVIGASAFIAERHPRLLPIANELEFNRDEYLLNEAARFGAVDVISTLAGWVDVRTALVIAIRAGQKVFIKALISHLRLINFHRQDLDYILQIIINLGDVELITASSKAISVPIYAAFIGSASLNNCRYSIKLDSCFTDETYKRAAIRAFGARNTDLLRYVGAKIGLHVDQFPDYQTLGPKLIEMCSDRGGFSACFTLDIGYSHDKILVEYALTRFTNFQRYSMMQALMNTWDEKCRDICLGEEYFNITHIYRHDPEFFIEKMSVCPAWHSRRSYSYLMETDSPALLDIFIKVYKWEVLGPEIDSLIDRTLLGNCINSYTVLRYLKGVHCPN